MANASVLLSLNSQGDQVKAAQASLAKVGITVPATETSSAVFGAATAAQNAPCNASAFCPDPQSTSREGPTGVRLMRDESRARQECEGSDRAPHRRSLNGIAGVEG